MGLLRQAHNDMLRLPILYYMLSIRYENIMNSVLSISSFGVFINTRKRQEHGVSETSDSGLVCITAELSPKTASYDSNRSESHSNRFVAVMVSALTLSRILLNQAMI